MVLIPADAALRIKTQADAPLTPVQPASEISSALPDLQAGQAFTARIQEVLPDQTFKALVAGRSITLALPAEAKAGDVLELVVVDRTSQLILAKPNPALSSGEGSGPYRHATLSDAAKLIGSLLPEEGQAPQPAALNRGAPLLTPALLASSNAADLAGQLAPKLAQAVQQSGVFYESHQVQWLSGKVSTDALRNEPQNAKANDIQMASIGGKEPVTGKTTTSPGDNNTSSNLSQSAPGTPQTVPEHLRPLVQQQLDAAAMQRLSWQGEVWNGQTMDWEVRREPKPPSSEAEAPQGWTTRLRLTLPNLGQVDAQLLLNGTQLNLALRTPADETGQQLKAASPALADALTAAGLKVAGLQISHEPS